MDYADYIIKDIKEKTKFKEVLNSIVKDGYKDTIKAKYQKYIEQD